MTELKTFKPGISAMYDLLGKENYAKLFDYAYTPVDIHTRMYITECGENVRLKLSAYQGENGPAMVIEVFTLKHGAGALDHIIIDSTKYFDTEKYHTTLTEGKNHSQWVWKDNKIPDLSEFIEVINDFCQIWII